MLATQPCNYFRVAPENPRPISLLSLPRPPVPPQGRLEQLLELLDAEARVGDDPAHGIGVDGIAAWDGKKPVPVGHHHMLAAFTSHPKVGPYQGHEWPGGG